MHLGHAQAAARRALYTIYRPSALPNLQGGPHLARPGLADRGALLLVVVVVVRDKLHTVALYAIVREMPPHQIYWRVHFSSYRDPAFPTKMHTVYI